jgi:uncharacterized membrane protein YqaE (UPF0057 family)
MTSNTYKKIESASRLTALLPICVIWAVIFWSSSVWLSITLVVLSFLPYLVGYNFFVRGWLLKRVEE